MTSNADRTRAFLASLEARDLACLAFYAPDVVQRELPNRLVPSGATNDYAALCAGRERGLKATLSERYEVLSLVEQGDRVAAEVLWTACLGVPLGALAAGEPLRAHLAMIIEWRDGKIVAQRNYDCYEPF